jgi:hypothetical protein
MALQPQISRPASTNFTRLRVGPNRVDSDRSMPAMCAPYPANTSTNAENALAHAVDCTMVATWSPTTAPTQLTDIAAAAIAQWTITSGDGAAPDVLPGDMLEFMSQDSIYAGTYDALTAAKLFVIGVFVQAGTIVMLLYNGSGATASTPAGYIPTLLWSRFNNLSTDPNAIP